MLPQTFDRLEIPVTHVNNSDVKIDCAVSFDQAHSAKNKDAEEKKITSFLLGLFILSLKKWYSVSIWFSFGESFFSVMQNCKEKIDTLIANTWYNIIFDETKRY